MRPGLVAVLLLAGCAGAPASQGIHDPLESFNRAVHASNKTSDRLLVRPASQAYGAVVPEPLRQGVSNLADVLALPGDIANGLLQGNVEEAGTNLVRLAVNLTFGLGGVIDFADAAGIPEHKTDFGETLAVWGVGEGPYLELPVLGPSTARDAVGSVVDLALNPLNGVLEGDDRIAAAAAGVLSRLNDRYRYSATVDSILYDSADSYAQARLLYLQNRRFALGQSGGGAAEGATDDSFIDPYEDPYGQ
ncbi:VacJ family lipoprotein [Rhodobacter sp. Har01]|uniref:MlaA family lipoprotein n=1 Tax=Rhodobacter sp. Har01 TaxID=2883999 RepID=UPI001D060F3C|nr:VacJ family lipoprotein [Rhodobacter sp. Har01]MCB6179536.1 VacJ family lipoprotein [Rhodobacter sp. Har01]